ncbi:hypothetical protein SLEP1_g8712 [Rubroshorea leprosula]|uniref:Reverse transcriptase zinc-binding domain-containing protein n=1 Tax=Rubroshorea leprosula TaxID=152421 RepID=A0AAV5IAY2_9ROSI|nr:hypothetical protein SLEP1_g8712 [Rubroshorea leprosula]
MARSRFRVQDDGTWDSGNSRRRDVGQRQLQTTGRGTAATPDDGKGSIGGLGSLGIGIRDSHSSSIISQTIGTQRLCGIGFKSVEGSEKADPVDRASIAPGKPLGLKDARSGEKVGGAMDGETKESIIDFSPSKEENVWLEWGVVAVVRSMSMISNIQERVDIDGGLINLSPLGGRSVLLTECVEGYLSEYIQHNKESFDLWCEIIYPWALAPLNGGRMVWLRISGVPLKAWCDRCFEWIATSVGEVIMLHADTKSKSILCDGRVLILCAEKHKIAKTMKLKVEEKLYEIMVAEEEWRADPDWWLEDDDRNHETSSGSKYSSSEQGEEEPELMASVIRGDDEAAIEDELIVEENGPASESGLRLDSIYGPKEGTGLDLRASKTQVSSGLGSTTVSGKAGDQQGASGGELNNNLHSGIRDSRERKKTNIKDCYPQVQAINFATGSQWLSGRSTLRSHKTHKAQHLSATQEQGVGCSSLSDGCIANRNQVIQRELNLQEVRRIFSVGKRLGIQWQDNEEEVQSRLLDLEVRECGQGKGVFSGNGFLRIRGEWGPKKLKCHFVNVYASNDKQKKMIMWNDLRQMLMEEEGKWMITGDFNAVRSPNERKGKTGETQDIREFDDFVVSTGLHPQFKKVIEDKWKELEEEGYAGYRCKQKLKRLKDFLKGWNKEVFRNMETHFQHLVKSVEQIDLKNEVMDLAEDEVDLRKEGFQQLWDIMWKREAILKQKSRSDWVKLGDQNTRYFHKIANGRKVQNSISGLWSNGQWVEDPEMVKDEMKEWLERPFTKEEIEEGLKSCEGSKAPGPDGVSVLVNGSPTKEFEMGKGLRQGDPLSPFLFLMVGEALHGLVKKAENEGMLQGEQGGLGVSDLRWRNWALLGKWWYRLGDGREGLWKRVVKEKFYEGKQEVGIIDVVNLRVSQIWGDIIRIGGKSEKIKNMLRHGFWWEVGEGCQVCFWRDIWVGNKSLRDLFPRLFQLAINKEGSVKENGTWEGERWKWGIEWRRERMGREKDEEKGLGVMLVGIKLRKGVANLWQWRYDVEGRYVVKTAYEFLAPEDRLLEGQLCKVIWCKMVPSKVGFFGWRLCLDRLPTRWNLQKRGVVLQGDGMVCGLCKEGVEDVNHLFCTCKVAWLVWVKVFKWWGVEVVMLDTMRGMVDLFLWCVGSVGGKELGACLFLVTSWYLWFWRNILVFRSNGELKEQLLELIKVKSYFWIRNKVNGCVFPLAQWQSNPRECAKELKSYKRSLKLFTKQQPHHLPN